MIVIPTSMGPPGPDHRTTCSEIKARQRCWRSARASSGTPPRPISSSSMRTSASRSTTALNRTPSTCTTSTIFRRLEAEQASRVLLEDQRADLFADRQLRELREPPLGRENRVVRAEEHL